MNDLHRNQRKILDFLLTSGDGATTDELAQHLEVSRSAAREHIKRLEHLGLLDHSDFKGSVGRPLRRYVLSANGHETFPRQYSWLAIGLMELVAQNLGSENVSALMVGLADKVAAEMMPAPIGGETTPDMLARLTASLNDLGYRSALKQSDLRKGAVIEATNCVYHSVAKENPELCTFDIALLENVSGLEVELETCIARGGSVCRFCLRTPTRVEIGTRHKTPIPSPDRRP